jgi:glyoxylase-like metal-dependent hydrolase (beta-lactamase superfamily II)
MDSLELGDVRVTLVRAGSYWWDGGVVFGVVPKTMWAKHVEPDSQNRIPMGLNCYLVEMDGHTVLIETGGGDKMDQRAWERMRHNPVPLPELISGQGFDPEKIDIVINSHLHWDHCGWNTSHEGKAEFPRASYFAPRAEWEHAHERHPRDSVSYLDLNYDPLVEVGQMRLVDEADFEVVPGIRMIHVPGHNRDMRIVTVTSGGRTFGFLSDLIPSRVHVPPTWVAAFDLFPLQSIDNKKLWLRRAIEEQWVCGFAHDPDVAFARITSEKEKFAAQPLESALENRAGEEYSANRRRV